MIVNTAVVVRHVYSAHAVGELLHDRSRYKTDDQRRQQSYADFKIQSVTHFFS